MSIYVDIDLDYLVKPIKKESINNIRLYRDEECTLDSVENFLEKLKARGLLETREKKFFLSHRKSYTYWWIKKSRNNTLIHIDAHSDMYRNKNRDLTLLRDTDMGCDDYIWYAIRDSFVDRVYWVIPENSYDIYSQEFIERTLPKSMLLGYRHEDNMLKAVLSVNTRDGEKEIEYNITHLEDLSSFNDIEMLTLATSPEFVPLSADFEFERAMRLIGAGEDEVKKIMKSHRDMPKE